MIYEGETKVLQYFGNVKHNFVALERFAKIMKVMNYTGLLNANLVWYYPSATCQICLCSIKFTFLGLIVEIIATRVKFLELSGNYPLINCTLTFCIANVFSGICSVMSQFELVMYKFLN